MAGIVRLNELPEGSGSLSSDDIFLFMDDPSGAGVTKKISLSQISSAIGGGGGGNADTGDITFSGSTISTANPDQSMTITTNGNGDILIGADKNMIFDMNAFSAKGIILQDSQEDGYDDPNTPSVLKVGSIYHETGTMVIQSDGRIVDSSGNLLQTYGGVWITNGEDTGLRIPAPTGTEFTDNTVSIRNNGSEWSFKKDTVDLHNGGVQNAQIFQFSDPSLQSVITGPAPAENNNAQRLIIQGHRGSGTGEGGDIYVWGGDADSNGGDIKIYAGDADSNSSGYGGYVNIDGGNGFNQGGNVSISAGNSSTQGGNVDITAGYPSGNVGINTNAGSWEFQSDGTVNLPSNTLDAGSNSVDIKSSQYAELYFQSGPSGTPNNYIDYPSYNSESYIWTTFDGTYIQNVRSNDGTNPYWNHEWQFTNDGNLNLPEGKTLNFGQNSGTLGPPVAGGGTDRVRLWDFKGGGTNYNYGIGVEPNHVWFAMDVNNGEGGFKFYSRDNQIFKISDDSKLMFPNGTWVSPGTYDNGMGGASGVSLNCAVGYQLNWQASHLKNTIIDDVTNTPQTIYFDSPITYSPTTLSLPFNSTIAVDASSGEIFDITLTDNILLDNPINPVNGKTIRWRILQDGSGNRGVTLGDKFVIPSSATSPLPWSTAANKMDILAATYHSGRDKWDVVAFVPGY